ncbi:MAG TPA: urate hydroxylase PuuD [Rhodoferax sp.]
MESYYLEWGSLLLRWVHVITAIAWIGSSFYFVFLDSSLTPPVDDDLKKQGVSGELWAVHGGGFYHPVKFAVRPPQLPGHLHWFYWEAYSTWLTGFSLFAISYLWSANIYLVDKAKMDWSPLQAGGAALTFLVVFWLLYDLICRTLGQRKNGDAMVGAGVFALVCLASWLANHLFAGKAAFLIVGAMMGTAMSANVAHWIIPGQRKMVASIKAGEPVDPIHGLRGKQRSVHNTYFTLPVLFAMLSGHYSFVYNHPQAWLVLIAMMFAGAAIRQFFVMRHGYKLGRNANPLPYALVGVAVIVAMIVWLRPQPESASQGATASIGGSPGNTGATGQISYKTLQTVLEQRCYLCHGPALQSKGLRFDAPQYVKQNAANIYQQAVVTKVMPMSNTTHISAAERQIIAQWFESGAHVDE